MWLFTNHVPIAQELFRGYYCKKAWQSIQYNFISSALCSRAMSFARLQSYYQGRGLCISLRLLAKIGSSGNMVGLVKAVDFGHLGLCSVELHPSFKDTGL